MVKIGEWEFEANANELKKDELLIKLEPQCALVLHYLCNHAGKVVSRDELLDAVWGREAVSVQSVPVVISKLRTLLGDEKRQPKYIETVSKRGYRLIADITEPETANVTDSTQTVQSTYLKPIGLFVSLVLVACLGAFLAMKTGKTAPAIDAPVLYVADVANLTNDNSFNITAAGASEILTTELAHASGLTIARLRRNPINNQWINPEIGDFENSPIPLLTASLVESENEKKIVMQLVDGEERQVVWTHSFTLNNNAFAANQRQATTQLFEFLEVPTFEYEVSPYAGLDGVEELYWRANFFWGLRGRENNIQAARLAQQALEIDPNYVPAHALIAQIYAKYSGEYLDISPLDTKALAKKHFDFAVSTAPLNPATLTAQTRMLMIFDRRPDLALEAADKAIAMGLNNGMIHTQRAASLYLLGKIDDAITSIDKAMAVEFGSPYVKVQYIFANYLGGRYEKVIDVAEQMNPEYYDDFRAQVAASYYEIGQHEKAIKEWLAAVNSAGVQVSTEAETEILALVSAGDISTSYQMLSQYVNAAADPDDIQIQQLQLFWSFYHGDEGLPLELLKTIPVSRHARFWLWLHRWPLFDRYKTDPEFQEYLNDIGVAAASVCVHTVCAAS